MELSKTTIKGLENVLNSSLINDETFGQLLDYISIDILRKTDATNLARICGPKPDVIKLAYTDLMSLFVEAARHKSNPDTFMTVLQTANIFGPRAERLSEFYAKYRESICAQLAQIGNGPPCIVDINWRLDYIAKSSTSNSIGESLYNVRLVTKKHGTSDHVQFACTIQQLQDLVYKLKEAVRHIDKIASA